MNTNRFSTASIVALVGAFFHIASPFLVGLGAWIQRHTAIVFDPGYLTTTQTDLVTIISVLAVAWHTTPTDPPTTP
jgi:hypothetical protein